MLLHSLILIEPKQYYHRLLTICSLAMNISGYSKWGVGLFLEFHSKRGLPTEQAKYCSLYECHPVTVSSLKDKYTDQYIEIPHTWWHSRNALSIAIQLKQCPSTFSLKGLLVILRVWLMYSHRDRSAFPPPEDRNPNTMSTTSSVSLRQSGVHNSWIISCCLCEGSGSYKWEKGG